MTTHQNLGDKSIAIIGAGLTGLLAAHGLQQSGFKVVVFEQEHGLDARPRDWTLLIHWAMPVFEKLLPQEILADLSQTFCNPFLEFGEEAESLPCYHGGTGHLLFCSPTPGARRVSRQALRRLLVQRVDVRWSKTLVGISSDESGVRAVFSDGHVYDSDLLLGTDGSSSRVRELLLGIDAARPQPSGFQFATGITQFADAEKTRAIVKAHPVAAIMMGSGSVGGVGVMSVNGSRDESTWTTFWTKIWRGESVNLKGHEALDYINENTTPLRDIFQSAIDWTPPESSVSINEMKYWSPVPWDNLGGRVTLAGDAAHPMLIFRGQGFQHSITDVDNYVQKLLELRQSSAVLRKKAFAEYDAEVIQRGSKAVQQSLEEAHKSLSAERLKDMLMMSSGHGRST